MTDIEQRIESLDTSLFDQVLAASTLGDRTSLLLLQRCVRRFGDYVYLEIGSYLGGTIQQILVDPRCQLIYSIDKRPPVQADEMRGEGSYANNSTKQMMDGLRNAFPEIQLEIIKTFDSDASKLDPAQFIQKPDFCFIDGEHTNRAILSDFSFCLGVCAPDAVIALHDANIIFGGLPLIKRRLRGRRWQGLLLPDNVYVFLLERAIDRFRSEIRQFGLPEVSYFLRAKWTMFRVRLALGKRFVLARRVWRVAKRAIRT
jgi:hypothetical protein